MSKVLRGTTKFFSTPKGWGFINTADEPRDIFVHYKNIVGDGFRTLKEGQEVEFELELGDKGPIAVNVRPLSK